MEQSGGKMKESEKVKATLKESRKKQKAPTQNKTTKKDTNRMAEKKTNILNEKKTFNNQKKKYLITSNVDVFEGK